MTSLTSIKIPKDYIKDLCDFLQDIPNITVLPAKKDENFRGKYNNSTNNSTSIIVYRTGTITFLPNHGIEELITVFKKEKMIDSGQLQQFIAKTNKKYNKKRSNTSVFQKPSTQELRVKLTQLQLKELNNLLDNNAQYIKLLATSSSMLNRYKFNNQILTLYKSGSIYSRNGLNLFKADIMSVITRYPTHPGRDIIIGQDEVGKGEYFGPLVVSSVALDQALIAELQLEGVRDSKKLDANTINKLAEIIKIRALAKRAIVIGAERFNSLYTEMKDEEKNLNDLLAWGHTKAFEDVEDQLEKNNLIDKPILLIIDQFDKIKTNIRIEKKLKINMKLLQTPRGEDISIAVAAASILAKDVRNKELKKIEDQCGYTLTKKNVLAILKSEYANKILRLSYVQNSIHRGTLKLKN